MEKVTIATLEAYGPMVRLSMMLRIKSMFDCQYLHFVSPQMLVDASTIKSRSILLRHLNGVVVVAIVVVVVVCAGVVVVVVGSGVVVVVVVGG